MKKPPAQDEERCLILAATDSLGAGGPMFTRGQPGCDCATESSAEGFRGRKRFKALVVITYRITTPLTLYDIYWVMLS